MYSGTGVLSSGLLIVPWCREVVSHGRSAKSSLMCLMLGMVDVGLGLEILTVSSGGVVTSFLVNVFVIGLAFVDGWSIN